MVGSRAIMHHLQLFFRDRAEPILVAVAEEDGRRVLDYFRDRAEPVSFVEFGSVVGHDIWMNSARLTMAQFLLEMDRPPFELEAISPSQQFPKDETEEPDLFQVRWEVTFWLRARCEPLVVSDISGHDWVEIYTSCDCDEQFLVITDEDGEELVLRIADIDMLSGIEVGRYSDAQLETAASVINYKAV
jgi:hypothetical protein